MDPSGSFADDALWEALRHARLADRIRDKKKEEEGNGQGGGGLELQVRAETFLCAANRAV